ncbi:putative phosphatidate phosphatase isoform X1 [Neodiprion lecontei]|uniref:Phosphatidate phosphatase isoform X1 n=1 Tax=Neodiprion lecontei TaxID=441921 RepID=A0ABM3G8V1_NEOLC|nr:putative phosphatidate phosphatase isoform X1 [Neodiprion lecontei]
MDRDSMQILTKMVIDFLCLFVVAMCVLMFYLYGKPFERGFFCSDESLKYPFGESTVTSTMLYLVGLFLPICVMICCEYLDAKKKRGQSTRVFFGYTIPPWVWKAYYHIGIFGFGSACTVLTTDIAKYTIGRLRPHFLTVCNTSACNLTSNVGVYVEDFTCNPLPIYTERTLKEARLSFPSGHSSFSAYTMIYLVLYLQLRVHWAISKLLKHLLQFLCFWMAWFTAMSRVSNYKHHWSDVLAGSTLGIAMALFMANFVAGLFKPKRSVGNDKNLHGSENGTEETQMLEIIACVTCADGQYQTHVFTALALGHAVNFTLVENCPLAASVTQYTIFKYSTTLVSCTCHMSQDRQD